MANACHVAPSESTVAQATASDTAKVAALVAAPTLAGGVIKRRPRMMGLAEKYQLDQPAIRLVQRLRKRYGATPLRLRVPGRSIALVLSPNDVGTLLEHSPESFSPATYEKKAALGHFQPHGGTGVHGQRACASTPLHRGRIGHPSAAASAGRYRDQHHLRGSHAACRSDRGRRRVDLGVVQRGVVADGAPGGIWGHRSRGPHDHRHAGVIAARRQLGVSESSSDLRTRAIHSSVGRVFAPG